MQALSLKRNANFRWLVRGAILSNLGDQLTLIAMPLLALQLTRDPFALGLLVALMGIPRAAFLLLGGAIVDRFSPQRVLLLSKLASAVLLAVMTLLVLNTRPVLTWTLGPLLSIAVHMTPQLMLHALYCLALLLGMAQAFGIPAATSIVPAALPSPLLEAANGILMGLRQLALLAGPLIAGLLLGFSRHGLALAFAIDGVSFLVSAWTLSKLALCPVPGRVAPAQSVWRALGEGLAMVWSDVPMRLCFLYWAIGALLLGGAMQVALPVLATSSYQGSATLGWFLAAQGGGILMGMAAGAVKARRLAVFSFGSTILLADGLAGLLVAPLGQVGSPWLAAALLLGSGTVSGFLQISIYTWIQRRVPAPMMGRAMSIFMFIFMGLAPLSALGAGWLLSWISAPRLFLAGGLGLAALATAAYLFTPMRHIGRTQRAVRGPSA